MIPGGFFAAAYCIGLMSFALVGLIEIALSAIELRRIDRDDWARGEPWQRRHNTRERELEQARARRSATLVVYAPVWPLLFVAVVWRLITRLRKERPTSD